MGSEEVEAYVLSRHNMVVKYIAMWLILGLYKETDQRPGTWVVRRRWEQEGIDMEGVWAAEVAAYEEDPEEAEG